ncbi:MAG: S41 family peptidase [Planctomycetota bacterium]
MDGQTRSSRGPILANARGGGLLLLLLAAAAAEDEAVARWKVWRADLDHLYEKIEEPPSLREIFKAKGIDWKAVTKEANGRFATAAAAAKKRRGDDARADEITFYGVLRYVVGQLRDSHAELTVAKEIATAWQEAQPRSFDAGIELLPGTHGTILVANVFAARNSTSPLAGKGVAHDATLLESVNGIPAAKYFAEKARAKYEEEGGQSTLGRAFVEALNDLSMPADGSLELVFQTLKASEKECEKYLALDPGKREKAFARLPWKDKKTSLRWSECQNTRNPRNFVFRALERPELVKTADKEIWYGTLPSGYGYVFYGGVSGTSRQGLDEACRALADCPGMVLDMRLNGGGGESGIEAFDAREGSWKKPVAVLVGPKAISAAETELWTLLQMREGHQCTARLFGRPTAGASGDKIHFELPSGFATGLFVYRHWHGGRSQIEGAGIAPDEVVDQDLVELSLGIDSCLRRAEEWLAKQ